MGALHKISTQELKKFAKEIISDSKKEVDQRWLTKEQACVYLGIESHTTFNTKVKEGILPEPSYHLGYRTPRWDKEHIDRMMIDYFNKR